MAAIVLSAKVTPRGGDGRYILRLTSDRELPMKERSGAAFLINRTKPQPEEIKGFRWVVSTGEEYPGAIQLAPDYDYLASGDIIRLSPRSGDLRVLYRRNSRHNVLFVTEQCNSRCVMCSQPPRAIDDGYLIDEILHAIPLMSQDTPQLCITGGEPTLNFQGLLGIIKSVQRHLPKTSLHMLSNGRSFVNEARARDLKAIGHHDFVVGIPLYSDQPSWHDFIVQSKGAFDETIGGLLNLGAHQQKIEIRFVIHRLTVSRMVSTAKFIARNLPFVSHVALMGLEPTGFGKTNLETIWIDPWDYRAELKKAVELLKGVGVRVSIYNHQLCVLPPELWSVATQSISDWKNIFVDECQRCAVQDRCAGFFSSSRKTFSRNIRAIR